MMAYSVELYFDIEFENRIRDLWESLKQHNVPSIMQKIGSRPHLAISILEYIKEAEIPGILQFLIKHHRQFTLAFPAISMIPGKNQAVFLSPSQNTQLIGIQGALYAYLLKKRYVPNKFYNPSKWLPHCTISKELSFKETLETFRVCENYAVTGKATVTEVGIIEFRPRRELGTCRLNTP